MTRRDWHDGPRTCSACSSTARRSRRPGRAASAIIDDSFLLLFNAHHEDATFTLPDRALRPALGARAVAPPTRTAERGRWSRRAQDAVELHGALAGHPAARGSRDRRCRATYRLQLGPEPRLRGGARARALPARPRRLAPLPVAVVAGARRARRTATTSSTRRGSRTRSAARRGSARSRPRRARPGSGSCSTSSRTTWRPTTRTVLGRRRRCGAQFFDLDPETGRHRRFFDIDHLAGRAPGGPRGLRRDAPARARARARGARRRAAHRPPGRAGRPGRLPRAAARRRRRARVGGEDPRPRRAAARLAGRGHGRLRVPQRRRGAVRRPGRRGAR